MSVPDDDQPTLYAEPGSSWWPVLWGPAFAAACVLFEVAFGGPVHWYLWALLAVGLGGLTAIWVNARRQICSVLLTSTELRQGRETLAVQRIAGVDEVGVSIGAPVLGGGWAVPKRFTGMTLRLDDGSTVIAWARDADALRSALRALVEERVEEEHGERERGERST
ncbi:MAG: hypothetical protein J2O49_08665 [Sciscionella sp.]|nr:hypothetical protein [Sciscionella sp.]